MWSRAFRQISPKHQRNFYSSKQQNKPIVALLISANSSREFIFFSNAASSCTVMLNGPKFCCCNLAESRPGSRSATQSLYVHLACVSDDRLNSPFQSCL